MATEAAGATNGNYTHYQGSDEASANHGPSASQSTTASTQAAKPDAIEIGWFFVEQYYTTLSKNPERIHLFYSKKSQLVTGKEAEKVLPCVGQKAISDKIKDLEFKDCKVRVLNVDAQASFQNIVVQVIGEMSNNAQPHNKFVQTFVLAEQPNGYFVLNDIFRYIDIGDDVADEANDQETLADQAPATLEEPSLEAKKSGESVADKAGAEELDKKLEEITLDDEKSEPAVEAHNGLDATADEDEEPVEISEKAIIPPPQTELPVTENPPAPEPSRMASPPAKDTTPAPVPDAAPVRKTWANMVGSKAATTAANSAQSPAAQPAASKAAPTTGAPVSSSPAPASDTSAPATTQGNGWQTAEHSKKQKAQPKSDQVVLAYVKGVTDKVDARLLKQTLESFGELKYFDVSRPKNCAFVEFATTEGYGAAAAANPHSINGESILVEERRPRPVGQQGNPSSSVQHNRGGATAGRGRGGFQGRSGSQSGIFPKEAGRGGFQGRGGSKGTATPKGRGQAQAA